MYGSNVLFMSCTANKILQDYSNPQTAHLMQFYPEETTGAISETSQAQRWKEMPPDLLTPMFRKGLKDFYVNELAEMEGGDYVIPHMWVVRNCRMSTDAHRVQVTAVSRCVSMCMSKR